MMATINLLVAQVGKRIKVHRRKLKHKSFSLEDDDQTRRIAENAV
jgi:hypothetical protein